MLKVAIKQGIYENKEFKKYVEERDSIVTLCFPQSEVDEIFDKFLEERDRFICKYYTSPKIFILGRRAYEILLYGAFHKYGVLDFEKILNYEVIVSDQFQETQIEALSDNKTQFLKRI